MKVGTWGLEWEWQDLSIISKCIFSILFVFVFIWCIPMIVISLVCVIFIIGIETILEKCGRKVNVHF